MFLTPAERKQLTGYARKAGQVQWLREQGWRFALDCDGWPQVARAELERRLVSEASATPAPEHNWAALGVR